MSISTIFLLWKKSHYNVRWKTLRLIKNVKPWTLSPRRLPYIIQRRVRQRSLLWRKGIWQSTYYPVKVWEVGEFLNLLFTPCVILSFLLDISFLHWEWRITLFILYIITVIKTIFILGLKYYLMNKPLI